MIKSLSVLIMAGGSGSRLWPASRSKRPKQFIKINSDKTLLQETVLRLNKINVQKFITICNEEHRFFVAEQLNQIGVKSDINLEPEGKNTAPAISLGALLDKDSMLLVLSADHVIENEELFCEAVNKAIEVANSDKIVTFGVVPDKPHTGYRYIKPGKEIRQDFAYEISKFSEKPSKEHAIQYIESGDYLWNSGIFLFKSELFLNELEKFSPEIFYSCLASMDDAKKDSDFIRPHKEAFSSSPSDSIDYALMEKTDNSVVIPVDIGWTDLGSWSALYDITNKDSNGNSIHGDVAIQNTTNSYIKTDSQLVTTIGMDGIVVIVTRDSVLICDKDSTEDVKLLVNSLKENKRTEWELDRKVYRPWGTFDSVDNGSGYQVKKLVVYPGQKLSVQMHYHRSEHWVVVSGTARVHYGEDFLDLKVNESTYHDKEVVHALENIGQENLELIEVQVGDYLGEDDIVRFEDVYGRLNS